MPLLPALHPLFATIYSSSSSTSHTGVVSLADARSQAHCAMEELIVAFHGEAQPCELERDIDVSVVGGSIRARLYQPAKAPEPPSPCHLYFHGGGFWLGELDHFDIICRRMAHAAGISVLAVDYRLAPEHKFPTAIEDCYAALVWISEHAARFNIDASRLSVGGLSAGGNFAAVVSLMARDRNGPRIAAQVLEAPVTNLSRCDPLAIESEGVIIPSGKDTYCRHYLSDQSETGHEYVSPLLASDLSGLPPALVMCAEYDPLAAEGKAYADRLAAANVPVKFQLWEGQFHGSQQMAALIPNEAQAYEAMVANTLRQSYAGDAVAQPIFLSDETRGSAFPHNR